MTWLVTGGAGFVGCNLAGRLLADGERVVVLDSLARIGSRENLEWLRAQGDVTFLEADIRDRRAVEEAVGRHRPDVVAHLAGQVAMTTSLRDPVLDFETNALGTLHILEAVRHRAPEAAVMYSSSNKVYGDLEHLRYGETAMRYVLADHPDGLDEATPLQGTTPYGCSKLSAEQYMLDYHRMFGLRTVVFRHSSMYGGRQWATSDQGWVGWFVEQAQAMRDPRSPPFTVSGTGKQVRDVLHAEDVVDLYRRAAERVGTAAGQAYNIGGGMENSLSLLELFAFLEGELGVTIRYGRLPPRASDQKVFVADTRKAARDLGWRPRVGWQTGIRATVEAAHARLTEAAA